MSRVLRSEMNEALFIDYVDTEWCLRCARAGISVTVDPRVRMTHSIGDSMIELPGFRVPVHSPERRYYRVRNAFLLLRYTHVPKLMCLSEICFGFVHQFLLVLRGHRRSEYLKLYFRAVIDGLRGRAGRYRKSALQR